MAVTLLGVVFGLGVTGRGDAVTASQASMYRPGGMALGETQRALGHDARAVPGCLPAGASDRRSARRAELSRLFEILATSETGAAILDQARRRRVHVCIDEATDLLAYYFAARRMVGVSAALSEGGKLAFLAHELAHVPQHPAHSDNRYFGPRGLILLRRVREAAAEAVATRIAWELRAGGQGAAWEEKAASAYGDVARAFAAAARRDSSAEGLLRAGRAAFDRWFEAPWRRNAYDRMTLQHLARISEDSLGLVPPRRTLSHDFLSGIAWLGGRNFLSDTGARALTDAAYASRMSRRNARWLEHFRARVTARAAAAGSAPVGTPAP